MKNRYKTLKLLILAFSLLCIFKTNLHADLDITKNKEFILTFLPNYHNMWYSTNPATANEDSVYIFIYAEVPTKGSITFRDRMENLYTEDFEIPDPTRVFVFKRAARNYALLGYNISSRLATNNSLIDNEQVRNLTFKVTTDYPVQVYGHSEARTTSESFNVLPVESLGNEYLVLAYNTNSDGSEGQSTPSQFAVVAVEDNTEITITPSSPTYSNGFAIQRITLNSGQVYLVQGDRFPVNSDLSSSLVQSTKPVAVFSGQQRSRVPIAVSGLSVSRDYLVEQMPPIDSWSNEAILTPFPVPSFIEQSSRAFDMMRVIAAYDGTQLFVNGALIAELDRGEIYEDVLTAPIHIMATAPIMAAGYKRSSGIDIQNNNYRGDPLLQIVPTPNQFGESYRFITIQAYRDNNIVYTEHYITLITDSETIPSIRLNGNPVQPNLFRPILGSSYRYAHVSVPDGTHSISADKAFGLFVCGYGNAVSYGYYCGSVAKRDDFEPPELQSSSDCFELEGMATDKKLRSVTAPDNLKQNVNVDIESFTPYVTEVKFSAEIINKYLDGRFRLVAVDSVGQQTSRDFDIPGFTVSIANSVFQSDRNNIELLTDSIPIGERKCFNYKITNYGQFPQTVNSSGFVGNNSELSTNLPESFTLQPGEEIEFEICFFSNGTAFVVDSIRIEGPCTERNILAVDLFSVKDENAPQVASKGDPCNQFVELIISDTLRSDLGIGEIIIIENINLKITIDSSLVKTNIVRAEVIDPYLDSYIKIRAIDKQGNFSDFEKSIPGFTIQFDFIDSIDDDILSKDFGSKFIGLRYCDSVRLTNYGKNEIILNDPRLSQNIRFSIPPSQLPLIINPGSFHDLKICYFGNKDTDDIESDTIKLGFNCIDKFIIVLGKTDSLSFNNDTKCDIPILFEIADVPDNAFVSGTYPNPAGGIVNVDFNNPANQTVRIQLFNTIGVQVRTYQYENLNKGYYAIPLDLNKLSSGYYNMRVSIGDNHFDRPVMLSK